MLRDDLHVLTGSYALDALTESEREDFERHLQHCASCEAEVRGLRETAARLAMAKAVRPPARMERRVLAATYRTRQLPPLPGLDARRARAARWFAGQSAAWRAAGARVLTPRLVAAVAAASVAVAVGLGITQAATQHQLKSVQASGAAITRVITAPDARIQTARTTVGGTVTVVVSADELGRRALGRRALGRPAGPDRPGPAGQCDRARGPDRDHRGAIRRDVASDHDTRPGPAAVHLALTLGRRLPWAGEHAWPGPRPRRGQEQGAGGRGGALDR